MTESLFAEPYFELAEALLNGRFPENQLPNITLSLPSLNRALLDYIAGEADKSSPIEPRRGWALMAVADAAAFPLSDAPFLQALAAWYLARAANTWVRPHRVEEAASRARGKFIALGEPGWVAACDWQQNDLPWLRPDYSLALQELSKALIGLEQAGFDQFIPHCRLSLAYAHIMTQNFDTTEDQIAASEHAFRQNGTQLEQARCWLHRASYLRRQFNFPEAITCLEQALQVLNRQDTPVDFGKALFQLGYIQSEYRNNYLEAEKLFREAAELFAEQKMDLWEAMSRNSLVQTYNNQGRLSEASKLLPAIRQVYKQQSYLGGQADNALDSGTMTLFQGDYIGALDFFNQAETLYTRLKVPFMAALSIMYQGETHRQAGHYQRALSCLEAAHHHFQQLNMNGRVADCQARLAHVWLELGNIDRANEYLEQAATYYEYAQQPDWQIVIYRRRAHILLRDNQLDKAIPFLRKALAIAEEQQSHLQIAVSQRMLAEALGSQGLWPEAEEYLTSSHLMFAEMGMAIEQAACLITSGHFHAHMGKNIEAGTFWTRALKLGQGVAPEIEWQAFAGLAGLAKQNGNISDALKKYRQTFAALAQMRSRLWQPALAGSYLHRPASVIDQAVTLATSAQRPLDALHFIEESKAQMVTWRLKSPQQAASITSTKLIDLVAEIRWLQQRQEIAVHGPFISKKVMDLQRQYIRKVRQYDRAVDEMERISSLNNLAHRSTTKLDLEQFCHEAQYNLGEDWIAVDYYLTKERVNCVAITPTEQISWCNQMTGKIRLALDVCTRGGHCRS